MHFATAASSSAAARQWITSTSLPALPFASSSLHSDSILSRSADDTFLPPAIFSIAGIM